MKDHPLVSICCITYNHIDYIRDCLDGFLMQEVDFPYEIIINDDCSTDGTAEIIEEYAEKFPLIVKPIFHKENQYSKGVRGMFAKYVFPKARGRYIAMCEGDDYWTDPLKLQKQVDFLEKNNKYVLSHSDCNFLFENTNIIKNKANIFSKEVYNSTDKKQNFYNLLSGKLLIRTASTVFRKEIYDYLPQNEKSFQMGDTTLWLDFSQKGFLHYLNESTVVYRISDNTASRPKSKIREAEFNYSMFEMRVYYCKKYGYKITEDLRRQYNKAYLRLLVYETSYIPLYELITNKMGTIYFHFVSRNKWYKDVLKLYFKGRKVLNRFVKKS